MIFDVIIWYVIRFDDIWCHNMIVSYHISYYDIKYHRILSHIIVSYHISYHHIKYHRIVLHPLFIYFNLLLYINVYIYFISDLRCEDSLPRIAAIISESFIVNTFWYHCQLGSRYLVDVQDTYPYTCTYPWKGSRVCKPCNVLAVRKYVRASMV